MARNRDFLKHLYHVLTEDTLECLTWDPRDDARFLWHAGSDSELTAYLQVKRGRFGVSKLSSFREKLTKLGFEHDGTTVGCHPPMACMVYKHRNPSSFFRMMYAPPDQRPTLPPPTTAATGQEEMEGKLEANTVDTVTTDKASAVCRKRKLAMNLDRSRCRELPDGPQEELTVGREVTTDMQPLGGQKEQDMASSRAFSAVVVAPINSAPISQGTPMNLGVVYKRKDPSTFNYVTEEVEKPMEMRTGVALGKRKQEGSQCGSRYRESPGDAQMELDFDHHVSIDVRSSIKEGSSEMTTGTSLRPILQHSSLPSLGSVQKQTTAMYEFPSIAWAHESTPTTRDGAVDKQEVDSGDRMSTSRMHGDRDQEEKSEESAVPLSVQRSGDRIRHTQAIGASGSSLAAPRDTLAGILLALSKSDGNGAARRAFSEPYVSGATDTSSCSNAGVGDHDSASSGLSMPPLTLEQKTNLINKTDPSAVHPGFMPRTQAMASSGRYFAQPQALHQHQHQHQHQHPQQPSQTAPFVARSYGSLPLPPASSNSSGVTDHSRASTLSITFSSDISSASTISTASSGYYLSTATDPSYSGAYDLEDLENHPSMFMPPLTLEQRSAFLSKKGPSSPHPGFMPRRIPEGHTVTTSTGERIVFAPWRTQNTAFGRSSTNVGVNVDVGAGAGDVKATATAASARSDQDDWDRTYVSRATDGAFSGPFVESESEEKPSVPMVDLSVEKFRVPVDLANVPGFKVRYVTRRRRGSFSDAGTDIDAGSVTYFSEEGESDDDDDDDDVDPHWRELERGVAPIIADTLR